MIRASKFSSVRRKRARERKRKPRGVKSFFVNYIFYFYMFIAAAIFAFYVFLPAPSLRTVLRANAEALVYVVQDSQLASFDVSRAEIKVPGNNRPWCFTGSISPEVGVHVTYERIGKGQTAIRLEHLDADKKDALVAVLFPHAGGPTVQWRGTHLIFPGKCEETTGRGSDEGAAMYKLPIHGLATFGRDFSPANEISGFLYNAKLFVYGYAIRNLSFWHGTSTLYPLAEIEVPSGSRVGSLSPEGRVPPIWWGVARIGEGDGFSIDASTGASDIELYIPGAPEEARFVRVGKLAQLTKDPNLLAIQVSFLLFALLARIGLAVWDWRREERRDLIPVIFVIAFGSAILFPATVAVAEPVQLSLGGGANGQGWMFTDVGGNCRIITAGHNLVSGNRLIAPVAIDRSDQEMPTSSPEWPNRSLDIGFLTVSPARPCPRRGLEEKDADRRLTQTINARADIIEAGAVTSSHLPRREVSVDNDGGRIVIFSNDRRSPIKQGASGAMLLDSSAKPLAVIYSVKGDFVNAVRVDVAATLLKASRPRVSNSIVAGWTVQSGRTVEDARGPELSLQSSGPGWRVSTDRGYLKFTARLSAQSTISGVSFALAQQSPGKIDSIQILGGDGDSPDSNLPPLGRCDVPPGATNIRCSFDRRRVSNVQIVLRTRAAALSIYGLRFEP